MGRGGVEILALAAKLAYEEGCAVLSFDENKCTQQYIPSPASCQPQPAQPHPLQGGIPSTCAAGSHRSFCMPWGTEQDGTTAVIRSARRVQQGCNIGPLGYIAGGVKILKELKVAPLAPGARISAFIDDIISFFHRSQCSTWKS